MSRWITVREYFNDGDTYVIGPLTDEEFDEVWARMDADYHHGCKLFGLSADEPMSYEDWQQCFAAS